MLKQRGVFKSLKKGGQIIIISRPDWYKTNRRDRCYNITGCILQLQ